MIDADAAWVASHALLLFTLLPLAAAAMAVALARVHARAAPALRMAGWTGAVALSACLLYTSV